MKLLFLLAGIINFSFANQLAIDYGILFLYTLIVQNRNILTKLDGNRLNDHVSILSNEFEFQKKKDAVKRIEKYYNICFSSFIFLSFYSFTSLIRQGHVLNGFIISDDCFFAKCYYISTFMALLACVAKDFHKDYLVEDLDKARLVYINNQ